MIKKIRRILAAVMLLLITMLFLDFTGTLHTWLGWAAKVQFIPALLALNVAVVAVLVVLTLVFGRIYCSVICPLGITQDLLARLNMKKNKYTYSKAITWLRVLMLIVFVCLIALGMVSIAGFIEPYSIFGRIAQSLLQPAYIGVNNLLAIAAERADSYAFYTREVWMRGSITLITAVVSLLVIAVLAFRGGRTYCNTICPVGTLLGFLSRYSWLKINIDADKCKNCSKCERNCKASCIDLKNHTVDYSRCVVCGNCLDQCNFDALSYSESKSFGAGKSNQQDSKCNQQDGKNAQDNGANEKVNNKKNVGEGRREFLVGAGLAVASAALSQEKKKVDGGLAVIEDKVRPERNTKITPPGSLSAENMKEHCTACQLCVSTCPNDVLRPSTDLETLMQPTASYEKGYCRPECNRCSQVCPAGAIKPITLADKSSIQIGHAVWVKKNCIVVADGVECGNCARHCPNGAIQMVDTEIGDKTVKVPAVNESRCIGCGACENLCPARPFSAIYVEGHEQHKEI